MKKRKVIDHIENALDRRLSDRIKDESSARLQHKATTKKVLHEQRQVSAWLDTVSEIEPPSYLREKILQAIPQIRQKKRESLWTRIFGDHCRPAKQRIAYGVLMGFVLGMLIATAMFYLAARSNTLMEYMLTGSALFSQQFDSVESFELPIVAGELSWNIDSPNSMVRLSLRPNQPVTASLQFNPAEFQVSHFYQESWSGGGEVMVLPNSVRVNLPTANRFVFVIKHQAGFYSPMLFKLMTSDSLLISKSLIVKEES